jgi:predicted DNA-binding transcriptional regulator YafY
MRHWGTTVMRQEKAARLLDLARFLAASSFGLTLDEMAEKMDVKRRTVERMRDRLVDLFPDLEEIADPPTKRWRLPKGLETFMLSPDAEELAAVKTAHDLLAQTNQQAASALGRLEAKVLAALGTRQKNRLEPDIEALMQAEAIAVQPGPRAKVDAAMLRVLRDSLLQLKQLSFRYLGGSGQPRQRIVIPYGILFGGEAYLIARETSKPDTSAPVMWRIDRMGDAQIVAAAGGAPEDFSLEDYAHRSFGVYQEETCDVVLRVLPEAADEARRYLFHPRQEMNEEADGSITVRLHGGGLRELAWSLFRWGGKLEIESPPRLKALMAEALNAASTMVRL